MQIKVNLSASCEARISATKYSDSHSSDQVIPKNRGFSDLRNQNLKFYFVTKLIWITI